MSDLVYESDKKLADLLREDDISAFDTLFHKYSKRLYKFALSLLKNEEDSRDIVQEVFFKIWNKRSAIDSTKSFKSFLFSISYNLIVDQLRLRVKDVDYREYLIKHFENGGYTGQDKIDFDDIVTKVRLAVDELPERRRKIYILSREAGLTNREIAAKMGITIKTVENQITLALKHLRKRLGREILPVLLFISLFG